jgi:hypothetical protein
VGIVDLSIVNPDAQPTGADDRVAAAPFVDIGHATNRKETHNMKATSSLSTVLLALTLAAGTVATVPAANINPKDFSTTIDNPFFPLVPNTTYVYVGTTEGSTARDEFAVTDRTKVILGVRCREVRDRAYLDGVLAEDTLDWFAQDKDGNVWYFGEDTKELDANGNVISTEGSWQAGVNGAQPGIIMEADPRVGDTYRQEFLKGVAEDMATNLALNKTVNVPFGSFKDCLETEEFTPLEPGTIDHKIYAGGVGLVQSVALRGGRERLELVTILQTK